MIRPSPSVGGRRVPPAVRHALRLHEAPGRGIEDRRAVLARERVVGRAARRRARARRAGRPCRCRRRRRSGSGRRCCSRSSRSDPRRPPVALRALRVVPRVVLRPGDDQDLPGAEQGRRDRVDRHLVGQRRPRPVTCGTLAAQVWARAPSGKAAAAAATRNTRVGQRAIRAPPGDDEVPGYARSVDRARDGASERWLRSPRPCGHLARGSRGTRRHSVV